MTAFSDLVGQTLACVERSAALDGNDCITFGTVDGKVYEMTHFQDCCEDVRIEDVCGDLQDLVGTPILVAEERTSDKENETDVLSREGTYTFYTLRTIKGSVDIRFYGCSDYYSEEVDFHQIK